MAETIKARVCSCGCGRLLLRGDGSPEMSGRRFWGPECRHKDKLLRLQVSHARADKRDQARPIWVRIAGGAPLLIPSPRAALNLAQAHPDVIDQIEIVKRKAKGAS